MSPGGPANRRTTSTTRLRSQQPNPNASSLSPASPVTTLMRYNPIYASKGLEDAGTGGYDWIEQTGGARRKLSDPEKDDPREISMGDRLFALGPLYSDGSTASGAFDINCHGRSFPVPAGRHWKTTREGIERLTGSCRLGILTRSFSGPSSRTGIAAATSAAFTRSVTW